MISLETWTIFHSSMMKFSIDFIVLNANLLISYWHLQILSIAFSLIIVPPYLVCSSMNKRVIFHHSCWDIPTYGALNPQLHPQGSRSDLGLRGIIPGKGHEGPNSPTFQSTPIKMYIDNSARLIYHDISVKSQDMHRFQPCSVLIPWKKRWLSL